jgi:hypothetical protein
MAQAVEASSFGARGPMRISRPVDRWCAKSAGTDRNPFVVTSPCAADDQPILGQGWRSPTQIATPRQPPNRVVQASGGTGEPQAIAG